MPDTDGHKRDFIIDLPEKQMMRGERIEYPGILSRALQESSKTTVLALINETHARVVSGVQNEAELRNLIPELPPLVGNTSLGSCNLWKFEARTLFALITKKMQDYPLILKKEDALNFLEQAFPILYAEGLPAHTQLSLSQSSERKTLTQTQTGQIDFANDPSEKLQGNFSIQTLGRRHCMLVKMEYYPENRTFAHIQIVKTKTEIQEQFLRQGSNVVFFWIDQITLFQLIRTLN